MKTKHLIIGRTASGKSTLEDCVNNHFPKSRPIRSYTTRPQRNDQDIHHIFITESDVANYRDQIVAYTEINGYKYFATKEQLEDSVVYVVDPLGAYDVMRNAPEYQYVIHILDVDYKTAKMRYESRDPHDKTFQDRWNSESKIFDPFERQIYETKPSIFERYPSLSTIYFHRNFKTEELCQKIITEIRKE